MKHVKGFDTVRAFAVFFVIIEHWGPRYSIHRPVGLLKESLIPSGGFGVNMFFVLSGFLITAILLNEKFKDTGAPLTIIKNFFVRRTLRIFPIYFLTIALCCALGYTFIQQHIWYYVTYTSNILSYTTGRPNELSHTWSLAVEEQFYLIWPWLIIFVNKKYLQHVFISAIIIGVLSKYAAVFIWHHRYPVLVFNCFDSFGIGGIYAWARLDKKRCATFERAFIITLPLLLFIGSRTAPFGGLPVLMSYARFLDSLVALAVIMFVLHNKSTIINKYLLENKALNFLGKISYGIYLYHLTFNSIFREGLATLIARYPSLAGSFYVNYYFLYAIKLGLLITICWLSYQFIELPLLRLKKRFEYSEAPKRMVEPVLATEP